MANKQEIIREYDDYGYNHAQIAEMMNVDAVFVKSALMRNTKLSTYSPAVSRLRAYGTKGWKMHATDRNMELYEILYAYGPKDINRRVMKYGLRAAADWYRVSQSAMIGLKMHFGFHRPLPMDALSRISYFSIDLRKQIDERDNRTCQRCLRLQSKRSIRYHKIAHPGEMTVDNCITLCEHCRNNRIIKHCKADYTRFLIMGFDEFKAWIHEHDPFTHRKRIYNAEYIR